MQFATSKKKQKRFFFFGFLPPSSPTHPDTLMYNRSNTLNVTAEDMLQKFPATITIGGAYIPIIINSRESDWKKSLLLFLEKDHMI